MARLNGSLPVVELPSYYDFSSALQIEERTHLAVSVILLYEYFLTMDQEIEFIWKKRWKPSSVLYIFVRYFGTLYNLVSTIIMFSPQLVAILLQNPNPRLKCVLSCILRCSASPNVEPWAGSVIWWAVQGVLQMRLYALYHGSKKLLIFTTVVFIAEIGATMWILISVDSASAADISFGGYGKINTCFSPLSATFAYFYVPCFVFEAMLCLFAIYAGVKNSRGRGHTSARFDRFRLIDVLIQGNVINFFSPLLMFILFMIPSTTGPALYFAETLFFRAPIAILAGCRLILSVKKETKVIHVTHIWDIYK